MAGEINPKVMMGRRTFHEGDLAVLHSVEFDHIFHIILPRKDEVGLAIVMSSVIQDDYYDVWIIPNKVYRKFAYASYSSSGYITRWHRNGMRRPDERHVFNSHRDDEHRGYFMEPCDLKTDNW